MVLIVTGRASSFLETDIYSRVSTWLVLAGPHGGSAAVVISAAERGCGVPHNLGEVASARLGVAAQRVYSTWGARTRATVGGQQLHRALNGDPLCFLSGVLGSVLGVNLRSAQ